MRKLRETLLDVSGVAVTPVDEMLFQLLETMYAYPENSYSAWTHKPKHTHAEMFKRFNEWEKKMFAKIELIRENVELKDGVDPSSIGLIFGEVYENSKRNDG